MLECFQVNPDIWQAEALEAFGSNSGAKFKLALKACKGPGKTTVLAWLVLWFLSCYENSRVQCVSITADNLSSGLWSELAKWIDRSAFLKAQFDWTATAVRRKGEKGSVWHAIAKSWPKKADPASQADSIAGFHADYVMSVCDESGGVPMGVMVALEAVQNACILSRVIQAGNPTHTTGPLYTACSSQKGTGADGGWYVITITGDPDDARRSPRIDLEVAREQIRTYGRDNPWVMVNILGQFPPASINSLLGVEEVNAAMERHVSTSLYSHMQKRLGIDVARFGDDRTVIFPRQGLASFRPIVMREANTVAIASRAYKAYIDWQPEIVLIDDTGHWGHGVYDSLNTFGVPTIPLYYSGRALNPRYKNRRAEMWIDGCKAIREGAALPMLPEMVGELTEPTYMYHDGVFQLEPKELIKARIGRSPDLADAYMQTWAIPDMPGAMLEKIRGRNSAITDADPYPRIESDVVSGGYNQRAVTGDD